MPRPMTKWLVLASLTMAAAATACTRTDATGPSDQPVAAFENQGSNN